jgi:phytoene synthase
MPHDQALLASLPTESRLAMAYARGASRAVLVGLFALDSRLAGIVRAASEPVLGQVRLAWWRDQLAMAPQDRASGEPLIAVLTEWGEAGSRLVALVDGWEAALAETPSLAALVDGRAQAFAAAAGVLGVPAAAAAAERAGRNWALADLASKLSPGDGRNTALVLAAEQDWSRPVLPGALRPLTVLHGLARRDRGTRPRLSGFGSLAVAIRLGLSGR